MAKEKKFRDLIEEFQSKAKEYGIQKAIIIVDTDTISTGSSFNMSYPEIVASLEMYKFRSLAQLYMEEIRKQYGEDDEKSDE